MLRKLAALGLSAALVFAPMAALAEDATPAATTDAKPMADTSKPMKPAKKHKHTTTKHHTTKKPMKAAPATPAPADAAPKS